jgi:hypothetical protein
MNTEQLKKIISDALIFYANPSTYKTPSKGFAAQVDPEPSPIQIDKGQRARDAVTACLDPKKVKP